MSDVAENARPMEERHTRQILLSRYYMELAEQQGRSGQEPARFAAINMLHEAFETAIVCFADALGAEVSSTAPIDKLVAGIEKVTGTLVPFRTQIFRFNKIRVNAKHHLVAPDQSDLSTYLAVVPEFISELTRIVFSRAIHEVSLSDLITDNEVRNHVKEAISAFSNGLIFECLVSCRRALYLVFEKQFDIASYLNDDGKPLSLLDPRSMCRAPSYAKSKRYIDEQVKEPFDMVVIDHSFLEGDLVKDGIDTHIFWNIWRLTPRVYQRLDNSWINAYSPDYKEADRADCAYVIDTLIRVILQRQAKRGTWRMNKSSLRMLKVHPGSAYYEKASLGSKQIGVIPSDVTTVSVTGATPGLDDDTWFYRFWHFEKGHSFAGYIDLAAVIGEPFAWPTTE